MIVLITLTDAGETEKFSHLGQRLKLKDLLRDNRSHFDSTHRSQLAKNCFADAGENSSFQMIQRWVKKNCSPYFYSLSIFPLNFCRKKKQLIFSICRQLLEYRQHISFECFFLPFSNSIYGADHHAMHLTFSENKSNSDILFAALFAICIQWNHTKCTKLHCVGPS